jgi:molybdopterin synthase catalytic subunit
VHRLGVVQANEASLWVEVVAPHRGEAFAACQWLIDQMKQVVPIWKKPRPGGAEQSIGQ